MTVSYDKLWALLEKKNIGKIEMRRDAKLAPITLIKMTRNEAIPEPALERVCSVLGVRPEDIIEAVSDDPSRYDKT